MRSAALIFALGLLAPMAARARSGQAPAKAEGSGEAAKTGDAAAKRRKQSQTSKAKRAAKRRRKAKAAEAPEERGKPGLEVRAIDLPRRLVMIEVIGFRRAPQPNRFTFTDDRQRHYVAVSARCDEAFPSGARVCELEIPIGYERHRLISLELHLRGLRGRTVAASEAQIAAAWEGAVAQRGADPGAGSVPTTAPPRSAPATTAAAPEAGSGSSSPASSSRSSAEGRAAEQGAEGEAEGDEDDFEEEP